MSKARLNFEQKKYSGSVLCGEHAKYHNMPKGSYELAIPTDELDPDDPIECEICSMAAMRKCGVI